LIIDYNKEWANRMLLFSDGNDHMKVFKNKTINTRGCLLIMAGMDLENSRCITKYTVGFTKIGSLLVMRNMLRHVRYGVVII
jgi:hypothetical protein